VSALHLAEDELQHMDTPCPQCNANSDLGCSLRDRISHHTIQSRAASNKPDPANTPIRIALNVRSPERGRDFRSLSSHLNRLTGIDSMNRLGTAGYYTGRSLLVRTTRLPENVFQLRIRHIPHSTIECGNWRNLSSRFDDADTVIPGNPDPGGSA